IDFLCVREGTSLIVVEIKRPAVVASMKELQQIQRYVAFMRNYIKRSTDPAWDYREVTGYLLVGDMVRTNYEVDDLRDMMQATGTYVRRYSDLLAMVRKSHAEFLERYDRLRKARSGR
ncbi:MAG: hypothetical protein ACRDIE_05715, partial [Chloroflexota bacterium]